MTVNGRIEARVAAAAREIESLVPDARLRGIAADLGSAEGCAALTAQQPEVDVLVNNVGIFEPKPFEEIPDQDGLRFFEVNVLSGIRLSRPRYPRHTRATGGGSCSSPAGRRCRSRSR